MPISTCVARAAEQAGERDAPPLGRQRPACHLHRRLGHQLSRGSCARGRGRPRRAGERAAQHARRDPLADRQPGGVDRLGAVVGLPGATHSLHPSPRRPPAAAAGSAGPLDARGNPERLLQGQRDLAQAQALQPHARHLASGFIIVYIGLKNDLHRPPAQELFPERTMRPRLASVLLYRPCRLPTARAQSKPLQGLDDYVTKAGRLESSRARPRDRAERLGDPRQRLRRADAGQAGPGRRAHTLRHRLLLQGVHRRGRRDARRRGQGPVGRSRHEVPAGLPALRPLRHPRDHRPRPARATAAGSRAETCLVRPGLRPRRDPPRVRFLEPSWSFRSHFGYQNIMYLAAGQVASRVTGKTLGRLHPASGSSSRSA